MNAQPGFSASNLLVSVAAFIIIVAGMKAAASLLVPFLLAVFIAILIASPFSWLQDKGLPAGVALLAVLGCAGVRVVAGRHLDWRFSR